MKTTKVDGILSGANTMISDIRNMANRISERAEEICEVTIEDENAKLIRNNSTEIIEITSEINELAEELDDMITEIGDTMSIADALTDLHCKMIDKAIDEKLSKLNKKGGIKRKSQGTSRGIKRRRMDVA